MHHTFFAYQVIYVWSCFCIYSWLELLLVWYFEEGGTPVKFIEDGVGVIWRRWISNIIFRRAEKATIRQMFNPDSGFRLGDNQYAILNRVYAILNRVCVILKRVVCCIEEGCVLYWRGLRVVLKRVVCCIEEGSVLYWRGLCAVLKRVVCYFEEGCVQYQMI